MLPRQGKAKGVHHHPALIIENIKGTSLRKKRTKTMKSKMTTNSQLSTTEPKKKQKYKQIKQTTRIGTESQKWRSHGGL